MTAQCPLPNLDSRERHHLIEQAAYFLAERRGCGAGDALHDWLEAQAEIGMLFEGELYANE
jgi:hypothetical protein